MFRKINYIVLLATFVPSLPSLASYEGDAEAAAICSAHASSRRECVRVIAEGGISYASARVCANMPYSKQIPCLREIVGKEIQREAAETCSQLAPSRVIECLSYQRAPSRATTMGSYENDEGYKQGAELCRSLPYSKVSQCLGVISAQGFSARAVALCRQFPAQKALDCMATVAGKDLPHHVIDTCSQMPYSQQIDCLAMQKKRPAPSIVREVVMEFMRPGFGHFHDANQGYAAAARICGNLPVAWVAQCMTVISDKTISMSDAERCGRRHQPGDTIACFRGL